jgi:hypothetical protein
MEGRSTVRLVKVQVPEGRGEAIVRMAFEVGIGQVTLRQEQIQRPGQRPQNRDVVDVEVATPMAKVFIDAVMLAPFYDPNDYAITVRQPRSVAAHEPPATITWPLAEPTIDTLEEVWQFSHITPGFVGRVLLAGLLLSYGMIANQLLSMVAALLFLPSLPLLLAIGFGLQTRMWQLARQGALALVSSIGLTIAAGALVGWISGPPMQFMAFNSVLVSALIALATGVAAGLALPDDAGRRELIGLAAASQVSVPAAWLGISLAFGSPAGDGASPTQRILSLVLNVAIIITAGAVIAFVLGLRATPLRSLTARTRQAGD